jgi:hypothetical protein
MPVKFLFMDEKYAAQGAPPKARVISLTGLLVPAAAHPEFRRQYYGLLTVALGATKTEIPAIPQIHAASLLPDATDDVRCAFLEGIVSVICQLGFRAYRVGYFKTNEMMNLVKSEKAVVSLCFSGMLGCITPELATSTVWPVMESDGSEMQDIAFAGSMQFVDYVTPLQGRDNVTLNNENLGEVLYTKKRSAHGAVVDCVAYLLHLRWLRSIGQIKTPYKERLADIAEGLAPVVAYDEVIRMRVHRPPDLS